MIHLHTLGTAEIEIGDARVGPRSAQAFATLLYLAAHRGQRIARPTLHALLYPESTPASAAHNLRQLLYKLRRMGAPLAARADSVAIETTDVTDDYGPVGAADTLDGTQLERLSLGFLPGYAPDFSSGLATWVDGFRSHVTFQLRRAVLGQLAAARRAGDWGRLETTARACLGLDPLNDEATLALAEAVALSGSKREALAMLDRYVTEVDGASSELRLDARILRTRIAEHVRAPATRRRQARMFGREQELAALVALLDRTWGGEACTAVITGEAGIGKTRLASELANVAALRGAAVARLNCRPHDVRRPMSVFIDLVPQLLQHPGALACAPESFGYLKRLVSYGSQQASGISQEAREADLLFANIARAVTDLLDAVTDEVPVVVTIDDAQWLDAMSPTVLRDLVTHNSSRRILLVLLARGSADATLSAIPSESASSLRLTPLSAYAADQLTEELMQPTGVDSGERAWCVAKAAGNPLYLHMLSSHYRSTGERYSIPQTLTDLLTCRLDGLDPSSYAILTACTVLSKNSTLPRLERTLSLPRMELLVGLLRLERSGLIALEGDRVECVHELLSDAALTHAPQTVVRMLQRGAAETLEKEASASDGAALLWESAELWEKVGDVERASKMVESCATHALEIGRPQDACDVLSRALSCSMAPDRRIELLRATVNSAELAGQWPSLVRAIGALRLAYRASSRVFDDSCAFDLLEIDGLRRAGADIRPFRPQLIAWVESDTHPALLRVRAARILLVLAELDCNQVDAGRARRAVDSLPAWSPLLGRAIESFNLVYHTCFGDTQEAAKRAAELVVATKTQRISEAMLSTLSDAGWALFRCGHPKEAIAAHHRVYLVGKQTNLWTARFQGSSSIAWCYLRLAKRRAAERWHDRATSAFGQLESLDMTAVHFSNSMEMAMLAGQYDLAQQWLDRAERELPAVAQGRMRIEWLALRSRLQRLQGRGGCEAHEFAELLAGHRLYRASGIQDTIVESVWFELMRRDRFVEAEDVIVRYCAEFRRDTFPIPESLMRISGKYATMAQALCLRPDCPSLRRVSIST